MKFRLPQACIYFKIINLHHLFALTMDFSGIKSVCGNPGIILCFKFHPNRFSHGGLGVKEVHLIDLLVCFRNPYIYIFLGSGSCPDCNVPLRRSNFRVQLFEDSMVEKEIDIRKRVLKDFNKKEEDFATLREYNDYLEEIETIIFNLVNNKDVVGTNKRIEQYKKDNKEIIMKNKAKIGKLHSR